MIVDDGVEVISGFSPGSFSSLNVETEMLFVGGTPLTLPPTNLIRFRTTGEEVREGSEVETKGLSLNCLLPPPLLPRSLPALWAAFCPSQSTETLLTSVPRRPAVVQSNAENSTTTWPLSRDRDTCNCVSTESSWPRPFHMHSWPMRLLLFIIKFCA